MATLKILFSNMGFWHFMFWVMFKKSDYLEWKTASDTEAISDNTRREEKQCEITCVEDETHQR